MNTAAPLRRLIPSVAFFIAFAALDSRAATLLEIDFQTYNSGTSVATASAARAGASTSFTLSGNATLDPTGNTGAASENPDVTTGYYANTRSPALNGNLLSTDTDPTANDNSLFLKYSGVNNGYGTGTMVFVFKPNFNNAGHGTTSSTLFSNNYSGTTASAFAFNITDEEKMQLVIGTGSSNKINLQTSAAVTWSASDWYVLALSYSPGLSGGATIYTRKIGDATGVLTTAGAFTDTANSIDLSLSLGNNTTVAGTRTPMNGSLAYFQWTDSYTSTLSGYDSIYTAVTVPEPSTTALVFGAAIGCGIFLRRRMVR